MKKLFYLLFISSIAFGSCTKQEPIDVTCNCSGISVDTTLIGYWVETNPTISMFIGTDFSGTYYSGQYSYGGQYSCDGDGHLNFSGVDNSLRWVGNYTISNSGNVMQINFLDGALSNNYTFTKQ
jgi:hypothetical protein